MSEQHTIPEIPGTTAPPAATAPPDVSQQIAQLADAVNRLVQAQQTPRVQQERPSASIGDIGGDLPGGAPLLPAAVDVTRLSPVQQIALGLRDAKPVGPAHPRAAQAVGAAAAQSAAADVGPSGAD